MPTRRLSWEWISGTGREDLVLRSEPDAIIAEGLISCTLDAEPIRLTYRLACTPQWQFRSADLDLTLDSGRRTCRIARAPEGTWEVDALPRPDLVQCDAIDIMVTPLTNTLPIRTVAFVPGQPVRMNVAYVPLPSLEVVPREQEYMLLAPGRFRYRSLDTGFTAELEVDGEGLVRRYGNIWRRA